MKSIKLKAGLFAALFFTVIFVGKAQEENTGNTFEYHSFSFSPIGFFSDGNVEGLVFNTDLSFAYKEKHLVSLALSYATETGVVFEEFNDILKQYNLLYGREFKMNETVYIDVHAGLGYFSYESEDIDRNRQGVEKNETIGLPLLVKIRFKTGARFSLGLQIQSNINSANSMIGAGIVLQWNKREQRYLN